MDLLKLACDFERFAQSSIINELKELDKQHNDPVIQKIIAYSERYGDMDDSLKDLQTNVIDETLRQERTQKAIAQVPVWADVQKLIKLWSSKVKDPQSLGWKVWQVINMMQLANVMDPKGTYLNEKNMSKVVMDVLAGK